MSSYRKNFQCIAVLVVPICSVICAYVYFSEFPACPIAVVNRLFCLNTPVWFFLLYLTQNIKYYIIIHSIVFISLKGINTAKRSSSSNENDAQRKFAEKLNSYKN